MKAIGCFFMSLILLVVVALGVGGVTWATDSCTVFEQGANLTMQGWGSNEACNGMVNGDLNKTFEVLHILSLGALDVAAHEGTPTGETICTGWDGDIQYTIRDQGLFHIYGHLWCHFMPNTKPFSNITQALGIH
jgi:hypothetical protein